MRLNPVLPLPPGCSTVVFLGPSLDAREAAALLPGADIRPPVRLGDLYALLTSRVEVVLIIDGVFHGVPPVWQREILALLAAGKRVVGAASMGALRALELGPYGMVGVGRVFEWYRDGAIEGDDEVALLHADAELGYLPLTLPLVEIRHALAAAADAGEITAGEAEAMARRMKATGYGARTAKAVLAAAAGLGLDPAPLAARLAGPGLKADDARCALRLLAQSLPAEPEAAVPIPAGRFGREAALLRAGYGPDGSALRVADALAASLADTEATARRLRETSRRWILADWAGMTGQGPSPAAFAERWLATQAAAVGLARAAWLEASALTRDELPALLRGHAVEAWLCARGGGGATHPVLAALVDWAHRLGIVPPASVGAGSDAVAAWIVQSGPGHFGAPDWDADVAVARALQLDGALAEALVRPAHPTPEREVADACVC